MRNGDNELLTREWNCMELVTKEQLNVEVLPYLGTPTVSVALKTFKISKIGFYFRLNQIVDFVLFSRTWQIQ